MQSNSCYCLFPSNPIEIPATPEVWLPGRLDGIAPAEDIYAGCSYTRNVREWDMYSLLDTGN
jgi:hypothetical protein